MFPASNGSCLIWFSLKAMPRDASVVFNVSVWADTSTVCDAVPTSSTTFVVVGRLTRSCKFRCSYFRKPNICTVNTYVPGCNERNSYSPVLPVVASRCKPCCALSRSTLAPDMTAPDLSLTVPCSEVVPVCAKVKDATKRTTKNPKRKFHLREHQSMNCSFSAWLFRMQQFGETRPSEARKECGTNAANFSA